MAVLLLMRCKRRKKLSAAGSKADYFKWMVYSVISGLGFKWATTKLSELNSFYAPLIVPSVVVANVKKAEKALKKLNEEIYPRRQEIFTPAVLLQIFGTCFYTDEDAEKAIDILVKDDTLWPEGNPSKNDLKNHIYPLWEFADRCCRKLPKEMLEAAALPRPKQRSRTYKFQEGPCKNARTHMRTLYVNEKYRGSSCPIAAQIYAIAAKEVDVPLLLTRNQLRQLIESNEN
ncbi:MAG: hypothetical protein ACHQT8_01890 [Chlamydiales bacterium]